MAHKKSFTCTRFENRNGMISWRVSGWRHGVRFRNNFGTKEEAAAEAATLEIKAEQAAAGFRSAYTRLSNEQLREAEGLFRQVAELDRSLSFYVTYAIANHSEFTFEKALSEVIADYLELRRKDVDEGRLSIRQFTSYKHELRTPGDAFPHSKISELTVKNLAAHF